MHEQVILSSCFSHSRRRWVLGNVSGYTGVHDTGRQYAGSLRNGSDALGLSLTSREAEKEKIPKASSLDEVDAEDGTLVIVEFDMAEYRRRNSSRAVKKTLSIPEWLNEAAVREGVNFSQILQEALMSKLGIQRQ